MRETIAVFRVGQLGDTIAALPAISAIHAAYPGTRMVLITDQHGDRAFVSSWDILGVSGMFSEVLFYTPSAAGLRKCLHYTALIAGVRKLRPRRFFYLAPFPRSAKQISRDQFFFQTLCGITESYGLETTDHLFRLRDGNRCLVRLLSETDRLLSIVAKAGIAVPPAGEAKFALPLQEGEQSRVDEIWREAELLSAETVIGIGPGSKMPAKRWPVDRFLSLGRSLLKALPDCRLVVVGSQEDHQLGQNFCQALGRGVTNWAGRLSVLESAEALKRCALYVGNDTGTMHLAAAVGTPCVAIFSARDHPGLWEPYGKGHIVLRKEVACAGCLLTVCEEKGMACLREIGVGEVFNACISALNDSPYRSLGISSSLA